MALFSGQYRIDGYLESSTSSDAPIMQQVAEPQRAERVDLSGYCSPVEDQGTIGSCTANAVLGAVEYLIRRSTGQVIDLSRLFVYYNARRMSDREEVDSGTSMPHAMAAYMAHGACLEDQWSYDHARWNLKPPKQIYTQALMFTHHNMGALQFGRVPPNDMRKALLAAGLPIVFAMGVPDQLMMKTGAQTGYMPAPENGKWEEPNGAHAMLIVGFDDSKRAWIVRNSWGTGWGVQGHVFIDYDVMEQYAFQTGYWALGPFNEHAYFRVLAQTGELGSIADDAMNPESSSILERREEMRGKLKSQADETRKSVSDRLRGPGAGGGYDKGPGVGGGYDKGPGAGGGYDEGPGAGGGYDRGPGTGGGNDD